MIYSRSFWLIVLALVTADASATDIYPTEQQTWDACYQKLTESPDYWKCDRGPNSGGYGYVRYWFSSNPINFGRYPLTESCEVQEPNGCGTVTQEPEECREIGEYYDSASQQCVTECAHGSLDHYCNQEPLPPDPEEPQCGPDHPDYQGTIGYGGEATLICGDPDNQCPSGSTYGVIGKDGVAIGGCISNEYNPPECSGTDVLKVDQWGGHSCLPLNKPGESNEPGGTDDPNNGDSDGDGQGDLTGIAKQLQDVKNLLGRGNTNTNNITESLKGMGKRLEDAIGNIPGGGGGSGSGQTEIVGEDGNAITWSGEAITMEVGDGLEELNAVQGEYESLIGNIRSEMSASFGSFTGAGGLQDNNITLFGQTFNAGLSKFGADLSMIGSIILFAASFAALGIIMGARD